MLCELHNLLQIQTFNIMNINIAQLEGVKTPFYYYDMTLLRSTLETLSKSAEEFGVHVHYAVKANGNPRILSEVNSFGLGADCVSGGEIKAALEAGFPAHKIFYAGVGKTDWEIELGIQNEIGCFNIESREELKVVAEMAQRIGKPANIALRVNPNIDAHTHHYITTGLEENKFGIDLSLLEETVLYAHQNEWLNLLGLHFHIGSQITTMEPFALLCERINTLTEKFSALGVNFSILNVGGGLGIDYDNPDQNPIPDYASFFCTLRQNMKLQPGQEIHCELGRSVVAQCGSLIARVTYVKEGIGRKFLILDGGMNDLMRPALYGAHHNIENITPSNRDEVETYDVVGPVCESSDVFAKNETLPAAKRGDLIALRSAGAYGESMSSTYNMRALPGAFFAE